MSTSKQVGAISSTQTSQGTSCTIIYYVEDSEKSSYMPVRGSTPDWLPEEFADRRLRVTNVKVEGIGPNWIITITADNYPGAQRDSSTDEYLRKVLWSYPQSEMMFQPEWFGADIAGTQKDWRTSQTTRKMLAGENISGGTLAEDCSIIQQYWYLQMFSAVTTLAGSTGLAHSSDVAGAKSYVYHNASPLILTRSAENTDTYDINQILDFGPAATKGTPDYSLSPFLASPAISVKWIGKNIKIITGQVKYYVKRKQAEIAVWQGVSGASAFPSRIRPFDTTSGKWLADGQQINEILDSDGDTWCEVTRTMKYAPSDLLWDPDKNSGTWEW
jgi:hypothetical protein